MQFARDLVSAALAKGESALRDLPSIASIASISSASGAQRSTTDAPSTVLTTASAVPVEARVQRFRQELAASHINIHALKRLTFQGVPDTPGLRATVWKVLLGYLPLSPDEWKQTLARRRTQYHVFCQELIVDPTKTMQEDGSLHTTPPRRHSTDPLTSSPVAPNPPATTATSPTPAPAPPHHANTAPCDPLTGSPTPPPPPQPTPQAADAAARADSAHSDRAPHITQSEHQQPPQPPAGSKGTGPLSPTDATQDVTSVDHPLSLDAGSRWRTFFQDNETLEQITRDVMRTHPDMAFFTGESEDAELHRQELRRALFMYAKLNPGLRYIQGMNELIAPLYYLFKQDRDEKEAQFAEADAFWCFLELISEFRDHFCAQLDNAQTGIRATLRRLMQLLQHCDYELWNHIEVECKVDPQYYSFRWITLLLSQEFPIPDTLRIWDTILGDPHGRMDCLLRICTAMILNVKPRLMQGDFTVIMKTLQRYPNADIAQLLQKAATLPTCAEALGAPV